MFGCSNPASGQGVAVVVDRDFGERLLTLAQRLHVWVCDTPINDAAGEKAWAALPPGAVWNEVGVTTFRVGENDSPEDMAICHVGDIDLHHPAWSRIEVYGVSREMPEGFVCSRPPIEVG